MNTTIKTSQSLSIRIFNIFSLSMTVSGCRYDNSRKLLQEETIRFLFVFKLFEICVFRRLAKTRGRAFTLESYFAKSFYKNMNSRARKITRGRVIFRAAACFPIPEISENTIQNKM